LFLEPLKAAGVRHAYREVGRQYVLADLVMPHQVEFDKYGLEQFVPSDLTEDEIAALPKAPPIEIIIKRFLTGTTKHGCLGMAGSRVRTSHPAYANLPLTGDGALPEMIVRFDWRNPLNNERALRRIQLQAEKRTDQIRDFFFDLLPPSVRRFRAFLTSGENRAIKRIISFMAQDIFGLDRVADQALPLQIADLYIDVEQATRTALATGLALESFLADHNIIFYDLCAFITEDGQMLYGEISQDCGRYRHVDLGELDKDAWRAGGSSEQVLEKWQMLLTLLERGPDRQTEDDLAKRHEVVRRQAAAQLLKEVRS